MRGPLERLLNGLCGDPRGVLGVIPPEGDEGGPAPADPVDPTDGEGTGAASATAYRHGSCTVRVFLPPARRVTLRALVPGAGPWLHMARAHREGVFELDLPEPPEGGYRLRVTWDSGDVSELDDPYRFLPELTSEDLEAYADGEETRLQDILGARVETRDGVEGTRFAVWAPRALAVNVMGSFNGWEARRHPMFPVPGTGVWELFIPGVGPGDLYKYQVRATAPPEAPGTEPLALDKADPLGRRVEVRPSSASVVVGPDDFPWSDDDWVEGRPARSAPGNPISIYEVHLGSWRRHEDGSWLGYGAFAEELLPYVKDLGFTHIELLPVTEHPHDASWGYQTLGYFAPTSRYGEPDDFRAFVDEAHRLGIGVILDWVPAHFPHDIHGLALFDGKPLYEHEDPKRGAHPDWGTAIFDYGRPEVVSFLLSSARYWIEDFHIDGLRVDAVASMLYLDYSRGEGEWEPNELGGNENLEAVAFVRKLNETVHETCPGALLFAEESTAWPGVTAPVEEDGLGFDFKWNMGWMNDTLEVIAADPHRRPSLHDTLTFSLYYAHGERHLLPLSHDEVVHLKRSLLSKMPGGYHNRFAGLRLLLGYMWTHPGAKLLFMGGEIGVWSEWDENGELDWDLLEHPPHRAMQDWVRALNGLYTTDPALHALDEEPEGFAWLDVHDAARSVLSYMRRPAPAGSDGHAEPSDAPEGGPDAPDAESPEPEREATEPESEPDRPVESATNANDALIVVANFSAAPWRGSRVAVPAPGRSRVVLDSDDPAFGG
ncbi:MAG: 1,4-alpha-glucan branching protein GlgB, partial [Gemmatimonadota bacterium]|nr:1,4-alpha-glucan branching protein GlgB [Gemmatimonadota bacterium]